MTTIIFDKLLIELAKNAVASVAALGVMNGMKVDLSQNNIAVSKDTVLADLTAAPGIANYTGYAQGSVAWSTPTVGSDGSIELVGTIAEFRPTDAVAPNTVWIVYFTAAVGGALLALVKFNTPGIPLANALNALVISIRFKPNGVLDTIIIE